MTLGQIFEPYPEGGMDGFHTESTMEHENWGKEEF